MLDCCCIFIYEQRYLAELGSTSRYHLFEENLKKIIIRKYITLPTHLNVCRNLHNERQYGFYGNFYIGFHRASPLYIWISYIQINCVGKILLMLYHANKLWDCRCPIANFLS